jgi:hypothetical protein
VVVVLVVEEAATPSGEKNGLLQEIEIDLFASSLKRFQDSEENSSSHIRTNLNLFVCGLISSIYCSDLKTVLGHNFIILEGFCLSPQFLNFV